MFIEGNLSNMRREMDDFFKQMEMLNMKNTVSEKISLDRD